MARGQRGRGAKPRTASVHVTYALRLLVLFVAWSSSSGPSSLLVGAAGWCDGIERGEGCGPEFEVGAAALELHLKEGEQPRDAVWGAGLIETVVTADVFVAGGGSAGVSAAIAAARSGAQTVLVNAR